MSTAELFVDVDSAKASHAAGGYDFLSPERQQKYDLLVHLLGNLEQPVFLSGPEGIGKSAFLARLRDHPPPKWRVFSLTASPQTTLEQVQKALAEALAAKGQREVVVLALDDAGRLAPGVLDAICRFAVQTADLGLLAALRPDELHLKAVSDPWAVGEAQVIELPPLSEQQCADYFERLWLQRGRSGEPDPELVQEIYRRTHGVPGWIQHEVVELFGRPPLRWHLALAKPVYLALGVVGIAVVAVTYWQSRQHASESVLPLSPAPSADPMAASAPPGVAAPPSPLAPKPPEKAQGEITEPVAVVVQAPAAEVAAGEEAQKEAKDESAPQSELPPPNPALPVEKAPSVSSKPQATEVRKPAAEAVKAKEGRPVVEKSPPAPPKSPPAAEAQKPVGEPPKTQDAASEVAKTAGIQPREWVLKQPSSRFALQIGFFRDPKALAEFARRHPKLRPLAYYPKGNGYVLLYGAFSSIDEVQQATRKLPPEIGQASIWRFKSIQGAARTNP
ncbi:hypothetical protein JCM13664_17710 [Methylothermus subterraneus]